MGVRWLGALMVVCLAAGIGGSALPTAHADPIATTFIYPVGNVNLPPSWSQTNGNGYYITQGFNDSCDPGLNQGYYAYGLYYCGHTGIDLASTGADANVHAVAAGVVTEAQEDGGYGVTVRIRHLLVDGNYVYSQYEHMQYGSLQVYTGQMVAQGQVLGLVGATGFANGTHLHFEIKAIDAGGPGYTFGNSALIAPFFDPLAFVAAHSFSPQVLITPTGQAIPEWPAESASVLHAFLRQYSHFVVVSVDSGVNVRSGPGPSFRSQGVALRGAKLGFIKARGHWLYVALPQNVRGWVSGTLVSGYGFWDTPWPPRGRLAMVGADGLNIRARPGQEHVVLGTSFEGELVAVHASTAHWTEVLTREGTQGWVLSRFLATPGSARAHGGGTSILAETAVLRVRSGPGTQYPVVGSVFRGTVMKLLRVSPHWAAVQLPGGTIGWVSRSYTNLSPRGTTGGGKATVRPGGRQAVYLRAIGSSTALRQRPGDRYPEVARVPRNTRLQVLAMTTHWARVALPASRIEGWVLRRLLR